MSTNGNVLTTSGGRIQLSFAAAILISFAQASSAQAQPVNKVTITMAEPCGSMAPNEITVALTVRNKTMLFLAKRDDPSQPWTGVTLNHKTIPADRATATLRFQGTHTDCQPSSPGKNERLEDVATFLFFCNQQAVRDVMITTDQGVAVSCVRRTAHCTEKEAFRGGSKPYPVSNMWIPGEELRVQLAWEKDDAPQGLLVFSLDPEAKDLPLFSLDPSNSKLLSSDYRGGQRKPYRGGPLRFGRKEIVNVILKQRFRGNTKIDENASDIENKRLKNAKVDTLILVVR